MLELMILPPLRRDFSEDGRERGVLTEVFAVLKDLAGFAVMPIFPKLGDRLINENPKGLVID